MSSAQLAEAQARLNVTLKDIISFYAAADCPNATIEKFNALFDAHDSVRFLELAEGLTTCMAFIDHDTIVSKIATAWSQVYDGIVIERKMVTKKLRVLEGDKNADPDVMFKLNTNKGNIDRRKAKATLECSKYKFIMQYPLSDYLRDPNFSPNVPGFFKSKAAAKGSV
jgi:hypothetical protein